MEFINTAIELIIAIALWVIAHKAAAFIIVMLCGIAYLAIDAWLDRKDLAKRQAANYRNPAYMAERDRVWKTAHAVSRGTDHYQDNMYR